MDHICVKLYSSNPLLCDEIVALVNLKDHFPPLPAYIPPSIPTGISVIHLIVHASIYSLVAPAPVARVTTKEVRQRNNVERTKKKAIPAEVEKDFDFVDHVDKDGNCRCHSTRGKLNHSVIAI